MGRSGTLASCVLLLRQPLLLDSAKAMEAVKLARGTRVIENRRQERFVDEFHRFILKRMENSSSSPVNNEVYHSNQPHFKERKGSTSGLTPLLLSPRRDSEDLGIYSPLPVNSALYKDQQKPFQIPKDNEKISTMKSVKSYDSLLLLQRNFNNTN